MSDVRALYSIEPTFPATNQHPNAVRYPCSIGAFRFVDAIGGAPTQAELEVVLGIDQASLASKARAEEIDAEIQAQTIGGKTLAELKAMTRAEYGTWFDANFDTQAKLIGLLKRLTLILIRRVL